jgi:hypothetical protein
MTARFSATLLLLALAASEPVRVPSAPGLYCLAAKGVERIEGRAVTIAHSTSHVPLSKSIPTRGPRTNAQVLGEDAEIKVSTTPVFYYRVSPENEEAGAADLVLVRLKVRKGRREFEVASESDWKSSAGIPLKSQVEYYARRVESGLFKLAPAEDLEPGEYGFYLFRGRDLPGLLYDFAVQQPEEHQ